jgi:hypothetical protein
MALIENILTQNYFQFINFFCEQTNGLAPHQLLYVKYFSNMHNIIKVPFLAPW